MLWPVFIADITHALIGSCTLIPGYYSPIMPTAGYGPAKTKQKAIIIINNLVTLMVQSLQENLKPWLCHFDLFMALSLQ